MGLYFVQFLTGLAHAATLFLVAAGLSLIFGVTRIVNFAHGALYMLGAYCAYSAVTALLPLIGALGFWAGIVIAALIVGLAGMLLEVLLLRRIYHAPELLQLLATFGVVLLVQDLTLAIWGREDLLAPRAPGLRGAVDIFGERFPQYQLLLVGLGPLVLGCLWWLTHRTRWGILVRAATQDREMAGALGVNQRWLFTGVLFAGSFLAGLGGALRIPLEAVNLQMDAGIIVEAFVVVVIGGLGSIPGAFVAALLIGEINAFGVLWFPKLSLVLVFLVMAAVLTLRPYGLLGRPEAPQRSSAFALETPLRHAGARERTAWLITAACLVIAPVFCGDYQLVLLIECVIFGLFALSLAFIMHLGGLVSFGHAAYFGLGAYAVAWVMTQGGMGAIAALVAAPLLAGVTALVFGWFCVRLAGVYSAMLTLALAQIVWSSIYQSQWSGGDNGILGIWPPAWLGERTTYYYFCLSLCAAAAWLLFRLAFAPFGYALRACRDSPLRAQAIGIEPRRQQWLAFVFAAAAAGLAGGLYALHKGSVFPTTLSITQSVDALVMVLLGGAQSLVGPIAGAAVFHTLQSEILRSTEYWRALLGGVIVILVIALPRGIAGLLPAPERAR